MQSAVHNERPAHVPIESHLPTVAPRDAQSSAPRLHAPPFCECRFLRPVRRSLKRSWPSFWCL